MTYYKFRMLNKWCFVNNFPVFKGFLLYLYLPDAITILKPVNFQFYQKHYLFFYKNPQYQDLGYQFQIRQHQVVSQQPPQHILYIF